MQFIKGENRGQTTMLPDRVEDYVSEDNPVRVIDAYVDSMDFEKLGFQKFQPNITGRPMYAPSDLLKLYVYGYMNRVRSSRRLEVETKRNLEVIWLLNKLSPDHKTISRFRQHNSTALKNVFKDFVKLCMKLDLYGKELIAIDGSKFKAVNSKDRSLNKKKLQDKILRLETKIDEYLHLMDEHDKQEDADNHLTTKEIAKIISELSERKVKYEEIFQELKRTGETQKSLTDPDSRLMMANGKMDVCYNVQTAVDSKNKMIVEFDVTNHTNDKNQLAPMSKSSCEILETETTTIVADVGYDSVQDIVECMENGIKPNVAKTNFDVCLPSDSKCEKIQSHTNGRAVYIKERNIVICPMGNVMYPKSYKNNKNLTVFYNSAACTSCTCKCTISKFKRHEKPMKKSNFTKEYDDSDLYIKQVRIKPDKKLIKQRKSIVEHPFGTIKRNLGFSYCLMKGQSNVSGEFSLAFLAYNLKRTINIIGGNQLIKVIKSQA